MDLAERLEVAAGEAHHVPVERDPRLLDADFLAELRVSVEMAALAMGRQQALRLQQAVEVADLVPGRMAGDVDLGRAVRHHVDAHGDQAVLQPADRLLVARNVAGGEDDRVGGVDFDVAVLAVG
ncbi:MAG: hypothetical protein RIM80_24720, partial [Alphaproteobacteria bacterium]